MTPRTRLLTAALIACAGTSALLPLLAPAQAVAQDKREETFRQLIAEATKLAFEGKYDDAITKYIEAKTLQPDPLIDYNIARCYQKLGQCEAAKRFFQVVIDDKKTDAETRAQSERYVQELGACPETAVVENTNPHPVEATPDPAPPPAPQQDGMSTLGLAGWVTLGVGGLVTLGGVGLDVASASLADDLEVAAAAGDKAAYDQLQSDIDSRKTTIFVLYGVGGAALVTGAVLLVLDATGDDAPATSGLTPLLLDGGAGAAWGGTF